MIIESLIRNPDMSSEGAIEFINYNTIRGIEYLTGDYIKPVIVQCR